jgi:hypothetical protein
MDASMSEQQTSHARRTEDPSQDARYSAPQYEPAPLWLPVLLLLAMALVVGYAVIVK